MGELVMEFEQPSFADVEYGNRRRVSRRERFLRMMDATIPVGCLDGVDRAVLLPGSGG